MSPSISIIIPTLNSAKVIESCLVSIRRQKYPQNKINILIVDGGSTDGTLNLITKYNVKIIDNPLKTAEAAKAIGVKNSNSDYIALIDSDNILPNKNWLKSMIEPLIAHPEVVGSEPWKFTYRPSGFMERYSALTGVNDPYALLSHNYDRLGYLNPTWTGLDIPIVDYQNYQIAGFKFGQILPTVGANGTIFRRKFIQQTKTNYLFDIDIISSLIKPGHPLYFAKVKVGIIHSYCESSFSKFIRKQIRRVKDLYVYQSIRQYSWTKKKSLSTLVKENLSFFIYSNLFISIFDTIRGFIKKPDPAWFIHPVACFATFWIYFYYSILHILGFKLSQSRKNWSQ